MISRFTLNTLIICIIYIVGKTGCYSRHRREEEEEEEEHKIKVNFYSKKQLSLIISKNKK